MYKIRDANQKEHGPVMAPVIKQWISTGRADKETLLLKIGETDWRPLAAFPEFHGDLGIKAPPPGSPGSEAAEKDVASEGTDSSRPVHARVSRMAVASLGLGLIGIFGLTGLAGLILGILAQRRINHSGGTLKGIGLAVAGMVLSGGTFLLSVPVMGGLLIPHIMEYKERIRQEECLQTMEILGAAAMTLVDQADGIYPPATNWSDQVLTIMKQRQSDATLTCPSQPELDCGYAYNTNLVGLKREDVAPDTVLFFESGEGWNGTGGPKEMITSRHRDGIHVIQADGEVVTVDAFRVPQLKWIP